MLTYLFIALAVLQVLDIATTLYGLRLQGVREGNKFMAKLMNLFGAEFALLFPKAVVMVAIWTFREHYELWHWLGMIGIYVLIVGNNVRIIMKARKK